MMIENGPYIPVRIIEDGKTVLKKLHEFFESDDYRKMEKNVRAKKLLYFGLGPNEYTQISECESAKEIWTGLRVAHEGTSSQAVQDRAVNEKV